MHLDHEAMLARMAMMSGSPILAVVGSHCAHVSTALSVALGKPAAKEFAENGRIYETFDEGSDRARNDDARDRFQTLHEAARASSSDDCSVELMLATSNGRVERIDRIGHVHRKDMKADDAHAVLHIRMNRAMAIANLAS